MNPRENNERSDQKVMSFKTTKDKKSSQKTTNKKISKASNNFSEKESSHIKSKKETININIENPPNESQIKKYDNIAREGMNYRVDIFKTKEKVSKLEMELETKNKILEKTSKHHENFKNYINKLEQIVKEKTEPDNEDSNNVFKSSKKVKESNIDKSVSNKDVEGQNNINQNEEKENEKIKLTISMSGLVPVITMDDGQGNKNIIKSKKALMKFLYKIYAENQNLKSFQKQVFDLSKDYDDINNILEEGISGFQEIAKTTKNEKIQNLVEEKLKDLKNEMTSSLEQEQKEYNEQLKKKEEEINMLSKAYENIYKEVQQKNNDKIHEQKTIRNLNSQIEILETKLACLKQNN